MKLERIFVAAAALASVVPMATPANATIVIDLQEAGPNVVATLSGSLNTAGLTAFSNGGAIGYNIPALALFFRQLGA